MWGFEIGGTGKIPTWHRLVDDQKYGLELESNPGSHAASPGWLRSWGDGCRLRQNSPVVGAGLIKEAKVIVLFLCLHMAYSGGPSDTCLPEEEVSRM